RHRMTGPVVLPSGRPEEKTPWGHSPAPQQRPLEQPRRPVPDLERAVAWEGKAAAAAAGLQEVVEQRRVVQRAAIFAAKFRVPLRGRDRAATRARRAAYGFGNVVGNAPGLDLEIRCDLLDALVVDAVDARAQLAGIELRQA